MDILTYSLTRFAYSLTHFLTCSLTANGMFRVHRPFAETRILAPVIDTEILFNGLVSTRAMFMSGGTRKLKSLLRLAIQDRFSIVRSYGPGSAEGKYSVVVCSCINVASFSANAS